MKNPGGPAAASQDAMLREVNHRRNSDHLGAESRTGTSLTSCAKSANSSHSQREPRMGQDKSQSSAMASEAQTSGGSDNNKWSQKQPDTSQRQFYRGRQHQHLNHQRRQSVSSFNLILSILVGLSLAAVHSSALNGAAQQPASSGSGASSSAGSQQQQQPQVASASANVATLAGAGPTSETSAARSHLQPPPVSLKPAGLGGMDQSAAINLIPVDQPVGVSSGLVSPPSGSQANSNNARSMRDSYDGSSVNLRPAAMLSSGQETSQFAPLADELANGQVAQQQQPSGEDDFPEPIGQFYANANDGPPPEAAVAAYQTILANGEPQQQQEKPLDQQLVQTTTTAKLGGGGGHLVTPRQSLERRFGLFKKGHQQQQQQQHYGAPSMSAPFMTDCERCLASIGQQSGELQQLDPTPPLPPQPPALPVQPLPSLGAGHYPTHLQPFAPLKSKLFMKFPFLVKPSPFGTGGEGGGGGTSHYWPMAAYQPSGYHHHSASVSSLRPSGSGMSQALFIRPAPAYNCIQASPPLLAAASSYTSSQAEVGGSSKVSPVASIKQQQQQHYGHAQQQVQGGYAK